MKIAFIYWYLCLIFS